MEVRRIVVAASIAVAISIAGFATVSAAAGGSGTSMATAPTSCPQPLLPPGTPQPTSMNGPNEVSEGAVAQYQGGGSTESLEPVCQWKVALPDSSGDPTVYYTYYGDNYLALSTSYNVNFSNNTGVSCNFNVEVTNAFGGGAAQETLNSSYCNTDGYSPGEGAVQSTLQNGSSGPYDTVASFHNTITSFELGGNVDYGFFQACSQDPVGQQSTYACNYFFGGPTL